MNKGKTYVVTGVASGIGAETSRFLRAKSVKFIGVDRIEIDKADQFFQVGLSDRASIDNLVASLPEGLDGLINISGLPPTAPAQNVLRVNIQGLLRLTLGLVDRLAHGESIASLASLAGPKLWIKSKRLWRLISTAILLVLLLNRTLIMGAGHVFWPKKHCWCVPCKNRWTWRDRGINMNAISPGAVDTPILKDFIETLGARAEEDMRVLDRPATPHDIAPVAAFALSDEAK